LLVIYAHFSLLDSADAWAQSGEGAAAAHHAESLLLQKDKLYTAGGNDGLRPTARIFSAVIST
jgi:hypothetical protein